jgi:hypothetical protein
MDFGDWLCNEINNESLRVSSLGVAVDLQSTFSIQAELVQLD